MSSVFTIAIEDAVEEQKSTAHRSIELSFANWYKIRIFQLLKFPKVKCWTPTFTLVVSKQKIQCGNCLVFTVHLKVVSSKNRNLIPNALSCGECSSNLTCILIIECSWSPAGRHYGVIIVGIRDVYEFGEDYLTLLVNSFTKLCLKLMINENC